jgi:carbohydrate-selective porin OprB
LAFPDAFKKGNLGGIIVGASPYLGNSREILGTSVFDSTPIHIEGFYKFQLNNYISVTPGIIYLLNPNQTDQGSDTIIGTIRTTFKF